MMRSDLRLIGVEDGPSCRGNTLTSLASCVCELLVWQGETGVYECR